MAIDFRENLPDVVVELENILDKYRAHFNYSESELMHEYVQLCSGLGPRDRYPDPEFVYFYLLRNSTENLVDELLDMENKGIHHVLRREIEEDSDIQNMIFEKFSEECKEFENELQEDFDEDEIYEKFIELCMSAFEENNSHYDLDEVVEFDYNNEASRIYINGELFNEYTFEKQILEFFIDNNIDDFKDYIKNAIEEEKNSKEEEKNSKVELEESVEIDLSSKEKVENTFNKKIN